MKTPIAIGVVIGMLYTLSPLTVVSLVVVVAAAVAASKGLTSVERRWYWSVVAVAVLLRVIVVAVLFLTADPSRPFASFFGDEELYKFRTVWVRNLGLGISISPADTIYSYDSVGRTSHLYVLAFIQALVGDAPYGLHMLSMMLYVCGVLALYRFVRGAYGTGSMAGLIMLLLLPSLAAWSVSILKEPMNAFALICELMCAVTLVRARDWRHKALAAAGVVVFALAMESLRAGGILTAAFGTLGGMILALIVARGRRVVAALVIAPIAIAALLSTSAAQDRILANLRSFAAYHAGHVITPGHSYQLVNAGYYVDRIHLLNMMPPADAGRFAMKAVGSYFAEPLPWRADSRALLAYWPEQVVWYLMTLLLPFGVLAGLRRDAVLTSMLVTHAVAAILLVALTSGNIGTLIRHRALALPYLVWLSALGAQECLRLFITARRVDQERVRG